MCAGGEVPSCAWLLGAGKWVCNSPTWSCSSGGASFASSESVGLRSTATTKFIPLTTSNSMSPGVISADLNQVEHQVSSALQWHLPKAGARPKQLAAARRSSWLQKCGNKLAVWRGVMGSSLASKSEVRAAFKVGVSCWTRITWPQRGRLVPYGRGDTKWKTTSIPSSM